MIRVINHRLNLAIGQTVYLTNTDGINNVSKRMIKTVKERRPIKVAGLTMDFGTPIIWCEHDDGVRRGKLSAGRFAYCPFDGR